jgi:hypothetical protein
MCRSRSSVFILGAVVLLVVVRPVWSDEDRPQPTLGEVYVFDGQIPLQPVAGLLSGMNLNGTSSWVRSTLIKEACIVPLYTTRSAICSNGCWQWYESTIELVGSEGTVREIKGANELPDILNRPLTGSISNRLQEVRIVQMRQQLSQAISDCREQQLVVVCVRLQTLVDPQFRFKGYMSSEQVKAAAIPCAKKLGLTLGEPEGPDKEGIYRIQLKGEISSHASFQILQDGEPRFGTDRLFYLARKVPAAVSIDTGIAQLRLQKSSN